MDRLFGESIMLAETTMRELERIENEDWKKAKGVTVLPFATNGSLAPRDYSIPCKCILIIVVNGYHIWWCSTHHQPRTKCQEAKKEMTYNHHEVIKAIKGSIRKWRRVIFFIEADDAWHNCPLCYLFLGSKLTDTDFCINQGQKCPIYKQTGKSLCNGSPYGDFSGGYPNSPKDWWYAVREWWFLKKVLKQYKRR